MKHEHKILDIYAEKGMVSMHFSPIRIIETSRSGWQRRMEERMERKEEFFFITLDSTMTREFILNRFGIRTI